MNVSALLQKLGEAQPLSVLAASLETGSVARAAGIVEGARPAVIAYLASTFDGPTIVISGHPHRADFLASEIASWLPTDRSIGQFPMFESWAHERSPADRDVMARRQSVVNRVVRENLVAVTSVRALLQPIVLPDQQVDPLTVTAGEPLQIEELIQTLLRTGYEAVPLVEEAGSFSRRGGIIDVFPVGRSDPARIELLGSQVDSLRIFDPVTQRSSNRVERVTIDPLENLDRDHLEIVAAQLSELPTNDMCPESLRLWSQDLEQLRRGVVEHPQLFAAYLNVGLTLADAAASLGRRALFIIEDPDDVNAVSADLTAKAGEIEATQIAAGDLPDGFKVGLVDISMVDALLSRGAVVEITRGGGEESVSERVFERPPAYGGRIRDFLHSLDPAGEHGAHQAASAIVITSYQHARLAELLHDEGLAAQVVGKLESVPNPGTVTIVEGSLAEGWAAAGLGLEVFTDHEIFGWSKPRAAPRRRRAARDTFFTDFQPGDYVVHIEHGIGRLSGTSKMSDRGIEREYLVIDYAGTDRVYVPTDQLNRVTRYIRMGEGEPQLNKLEGQEWSRAKARAQKSAEDMAEELIALYAQREAEGGHAFAPDTPWQRELESSFPYEETTDQLQAITDVKADMEEQKPMDRLVVADVGYGKTEVAIRAAFKAVIDGAQVAILVPTTVLGQQHYETFRERLDAFPVRVEMLSRFRSPKEQKEILKKLSIGELDVVIGTHRLLGKDVTFKNLGLLVVDEEQRFGVRHKERLKQLRATVDVLTLTATPIPRTLHMSLTGIRDVSIIQTPPEGRLPIRTFLQPYEDRLIREAIIRELEREGQVYFVHNRVQGIEAVAQKLRRMVPEARVLIGHGQMAEDQLEKVMLSFSHREADVLLCSTIIESGLDIPNVNTIVIDHAESLGLAQLYQLRGRVGRGANQAYAYLLYPRDARIGKDAMHRMEAVFDATELGAGFKIAMTDLEIRGAGNLLGSEQSGNVAAIGFDLYTDLLKDAIERQRGHRRPERTQVTIDLPFDVLIPDSFVADERERMSLYRRVATLESSEQVVPFAEELRDRFGPVPVPVRNLLDQVGVKFLAEAAGVTVVSLRGDRLTIKGTKHLVFDRVALYRRFAMDAKIEENTLRIYASSLGEDWLQAIRDVLADTAALKQRQSSATAEAVPDGKRAEPAEAPT